MRLTVTILLLLAVSGALGAARSGLELQGTLNIRGATSVDPPSDEAANTHAAFLIQGMSAKALYETLPGRPERDLCLDDGSVRKKAGNLTCVRLADDAGYECDFAINIKTQAIEAGRAC